MNGQDIIYDITIFAGTNYTIDFAYTEDDETPVSMRGWYAEATLRDFPESPDGIDFICTADALGIHLALTPSQTRDIGYRMGVYDVFVTTPDNNESIKLVKGRAYINADSARWD